MKRRRWNIGLLVSRSGGACEYCGKILARDEMTIDHIKPLSLGGVDAIDNMALACAGCNQDKGDLYYDSDKCAG